MASTLSAKEVAQAFGTDARSLRKFLRHHLPKDEQPGQGGRYSFSKGEVTKLKKAFDAWAKGKSSKDAEAKVKGKGKRKDSQPEPTIEDEIEEITDLDDVETSDDEGDEG